METEGCREVVLPEQYLSALRGGACPRLRAGVEAPPPQLSAADARVVGSAPVRVAADGRLHDTRMLADKNCGHV